MTFSEFFDSNLSCDVCPVREAGFCRVGTYPEYEPPCAGLDSDIDMNEWVAEAEKSFERHEKAESEKRRKQEEEERKRAEINAKRRERQKAMESYCHKELTAYKETQKALNAINTRIENAETKAAIINHTNEFFGNTDRVSVSEKLYKAKDECEKLFNEAEVLYKAKRKEFNRQYKGGK